VVIWIQKEEAKLPQGSALKAYLFLVKKKIMIKAQFNLQNTIFRNP
jgi:hypothetical protein